jgi:hypothetical protein
VGSDGSLKPDTPMRLTGYFIDGHHLDIRPAPLERTWMEATGQRFAYRCLPLAFANAHGWEILCSSNFTAVWNGDNGLDGISVEPDADSDAVAGSHFGHGILTFHVNCLFQTDQDVDLMVQGRVNRPKDGIAPLSGVIETDWSPYSFTMNWLFTRTDTLIQFEKGEPFCHIFPIRRGELEGITSRRSSIPAREGADPAGAASRFVAYPFCSGLLNQPTRDESRSMRSGIRRHLK